MHACAHVIYTRVHVYIHARLRFPHSSHTQKRRLTFKRHFTMPALLTSPTEEKKTTTRINYRRPKCPHGKQRNYCRQCNPRGYCEHDRERKGCTKCKGSSVCVHLRKKNTCRLCHGSSICEHGRHRSMCKECTASLTCVHLRRKSQCMECSPGNFCVHNRRRNRCKECKGKATSPWCLRCLAVQLTSPERIAASVCANCEETLNQESVKTCSVGGELKATGDNLTTFCDQLATFYDGSDLREMGTLECSHWPGSV